MLDIVFVILNFNIFTETVNCINSIKKNIDTEKYSIVLVDNGSELSIVNNLSNAYKDDEKVDLLFLNDNLGFSRGNNEGIKYARNIGTDFICCLNNDTLLEQKDFFHTLKLNYSHGLPAVIGPKIILKDNSIYHIEKRYLLTIEEYENIIENNPGFIFRLKRALLKNNFISTFNIWLKRNRVEKELDDVIVHGCCVIFTPVFFTKLEGFDNRTFMYMEEELLYIMLKKNNLYSRYAPQLCIRHLEDVSTNKIVGNNSEKIKFKKYHMKQSFEILKKELEQNSSLVYENRLK